MGKKTNELESLFNLIRQAEITPNDFYCLYSLQQKVTPTGIHHATSVTSLFNTKMISYNKSNTIVITPKGEELLDEAERIYSAKKKDADKQLMGEEYLDNILKYNNIFPAIKLPSGKPGRSNEKTIGECFKWFFENYDYSWEVIHTATEQYVEHYRSKRFMYMQTSQYFIRKQNIDKTWRSDLADWCEMVVNGEEPDNQDFFKERVV